MSAERRKRVLLITYYWPPAGGSGVQRSVKFTKYLREFGWEPIIFTVRNGEYPERDQTLIRDIPEDIEVVTAPTYEPYAIFRALTGHKQHVNANLFHNRQKKGVISRLLFWIRSNLFIPDARIGWLIPAKRRLNTFLRQESVDAIISTGPPHTVHLIAASVSKKFSIPWLADFRDPWTGIDYFDKLALTSAARRLHQRLEYRTLTQADSVITVSPFLQKMLEGISHRKVHVITNGFDEENFIHKRPAPDTRFTIVHMGMLGGARDHRIFWQALATLAQHDQAFHEALEIRLYGKVDAGILEAVPPVLARNTSLEHYVPHAVVPKILQRAQLLYLPIHDCAIDAGFLPGKLFEYLAARRPIISIGPVHGDAANVIRSLQAGVTVHYTDLDALIHYFRERFQAYQDHIPFEASSSLAQFSRRNLTAALADLLNTHLPTPSSHGTSPG
ncbi:glycosyltransferase family 4 protein [Dawidia soli]|uniref:Glycosyltransferase family 4 protein n=1 Tax=Dawidia soli TaxID=2782352 RepID=A0AAP2DAX5_9BACT|nr:glycosyltransferase family 4 protein [Dawidia soli]MBT1688172.1 glycosyltransferase family 4 protein [Dawidia soli]